jgi:hypothetical protein
MGSKLEVGGIIDEAEVPSIGYNSFRFEMNYGYPGGTREKGLI